ncbi:MAG: hypothetical protein N4A38_02365 [Candidatus Gracilibacteria bacterium]|jgi:hypothetical protein|nr:hypothetical protein [Candidatus Gracilibacteria bacterium]
MMKRFFSLVLVMVTLGTPAATFADNSEKAEIVSKIQKIMANTNSTLKDMRMLVFVSPRNKGQKLPIIVGRMSRKKLTLRFGRDTEAFSKETMCDLSIWQLKRFLGAATIMDTPAPKEAIFEFVEME